ncbi:MAG: hypothetical protein RIG61_07445 [Deltaproteobacteria bacterium]
MGICLWDIKENSVPPHLNFLLDGEEEKEKGGASFDRLRMKRD